MPKSRPFTEKDRLEWEYWREYISDNGGYVTSTPEVQTIAFQVKPDSTLPQLLESAGLSLSNAGVAERLLPSVIEEQRGSRTINTQSIVPTKVSVWTFKLPLIETNKAAT
jgi:hypothetical protein